MSDEWEETNAEFSRLSAVTTSPLLADLTFRTVAVALTREQGAALTRRFLRASPATDDCDDAWAAAAAAASSATPSAVAADAAALQAAAARLDEAAGAAGLLPGRGGGGGVFAKLEDLSPKDRAADDLGVLLPLVAAEEAAPQQQQRPAASNACLLALLRARGRTLRCGDGAAALALLGSSARCVRDELAARKGYPEHPTAAPVVLLREWADVDPERELRAFVVRGRLRGLSQMATLGVAGVHSDFLLARRGAVAASAQRFFEGTLAPRLAHAGLEGATYVVDLLLIGDGGEGGGGGGGDGEPFGWRVVELNPFATSMEGHLFVPFPQDWVDGGGGGGGGDDDEAAAAGSFELRLHPHTPGDVLSDPEMPASWRRYLASSGDVYGAPCFGSGGGGGSGGDVASAVTELLRPEVWGGGGGDQRTAVVLAGRRVVSEADPGEVEDFVLPALRAAACFLEDGFGAVAVVARTEELTADEAVEEEGAAEESGDGCDEESFRRWLASRPVVGGGGGACGVLEVGMHISLRPPGKHAMYSAEVLRVGGDDGGGGGVTVFVAGSGPVTYSAAQWANDVLWVPRGADAAAAAAAAAEALAALPEPELRRRHAEAVRAARAAAAGRRARERARVSAAVARLERSAAAAAAGGGSEGPRARRLVLLGSGAACSPEGFDAALRAGARRTGGPLVAFAASHGGQPDRECGGYYAHTPHGGGRYASAALEGTVRALPRAQPVLLLWGTCHSEGMVAWAAAPAAEEEEEAGTSGPPPSPHLAVLASAPRELPTTSAFMDAVPVALRALRRRRREEEAAAAAATATVGDLLDAMRAEAAAGWPAAAAAAAPAAACWQEAEAPQPDAAALFRGVCGTGVDLGVFFALAGGEEDGRVGAVAEEEEKEEEDSVLSSHAFVCDAGRSSKFVCSEWVRRHCPSVAGRSPTDLGPVSLAALRVVMKGLESGVGGGRGGVMLADVSGCGFAFSDVLLALAEAGWDEGAAVWVEIMEKLETGGLEKGPEDGAAAGGGETPFWGSTAAPGNLSYSFEVEGRSPRILELYMPGGGGGGGGGSGGAEREKEEAAWLATPLAERWAAVMRAGRGWLTPLYRMAHAPVFFNPQLHPEANGTCWEVMYGGRTKGYVETLEELMAGVDACVGAGLGLSLVELEGDSGVQVHVAFPTPHDAAARRFVVLLLVHLSDHLVLRNAGRSIVDPLNPPLSTAAVHALADAAAAESPAVLAGLLTCGGGGGGGGGQSLQPNPAYKHLAVGFRGGDVYKEGCGRIGFEVRRGCQDADDLERVLRALRGALVAGRGEGAEGVGRRVRFGRGGGGCTMEETAAYVLGGGRVCGAEDDDDAAAWERHGVSAEALESFAAVWVAAVCERERLERARKYCVLDGWRTTPPEAEEAALAAVRAAAGRHVRAVLGLVLLSDLRRFPGGRLSAGLAEEQAVLRGEVGQGAPTSEPGVAEVYYADLRVRVVEFARRMAVLY